MLKGNVAGPAPLNELISPTPLLLLAPNEPPAPIANLSPAQRNAQVACINAGGLYKKAGACMDRSAASRYPALRLRTSPEMEC